MADDILDFFGDQEPFYSDDVKVVAIRHFFFEPQARLYAARLKSEGVPCFISNSNAITAFPLGEAGIGLHIRKQDKEKALKIILQLEEEEKAEPDFRNANHADIAFQEEVAKSQSPPSKWWLILIGIIIALFLLRALLRMDSSFPAWDFF